MYDVLVIAQWIGHPPLVHEIVGSPAHSVEFR